MERHEFDQAMRHALDTQVVWRVVPQRPGPHTGQPYATHEGILEIPGVGAIPCYKLNTGERVFDAETLMRLFGLETDEEHT